MSLILPGNTSQKKISDITSAPIMSLKVLYDGMPKTSGCEKCSEINNSDPIWCCRYLNPHMYYVEFMYIWEDIKTWNKEKRLDLIARAIKSHLNNSDEKGCCAWSDKCEIYERRPFACRMYGIVSPESWDERIKSLRDRFNKEHGDDLFDKTNKRCVQCDLVKTESGNCVSKQQEDAWFEHIQKCEQRTGMSSHAIKLHDDSGGAYRSLHDHVLLEMFDDDFLTNLSKLRLQNPSLEDIDAFVVVLLESVKTSIQEQKQQKKIILL